MALDGDAEVMRYLTGRARARAEVLEEWLPVMSRDTGTDGRLGYWAGLTDAGFVGWWCLNPAPEDPGDAELGYRLSRDAWGRGYATEALLASVEAARAAGVRRLEAGVHVDHPASCRVLEKAGFLREGIRPGHFPNLPPAATRDAALYALAL